MFLCLWALANKEADIIIIIIQEDWCISIMKSWNTSTLKSKTNVFYATVWYKIIFWHLTIPDIHEAQIHPSFMFCLIFSPIQNVSKTWMILFWPRVHRWEKWSQLWKMPPGGRAEIENVKSAKSDIFNFSSATRWHFSTLDPLFPSMDHWSKKYHSGFWYIVY